MRQSQEPTLVDRPYWLQAIALLGLLASVAIVSNPDTLQILRILSAGILTTIWVTLVAFALAVVLGVLIAIMRTSHKPVLNQIATFYVQVLRGIPILVFLFYVAFVGAPAIAAAANWLTSPLQRLGLAPAVTVRNFDFTARAILALVICYSAFLSEIFRAGIEAVPKGQIDAARALGFSGLNLYRKIVGPQAIRIVFPAVGNQLIAMVKDSSLVSVLGVQDVTQLANVYSAASYKFFATYNVLAFIYLAIVISLSTSLRALEHRMRIE